MGHMKSGLQILFENYEGRDKQFRRHRLRRQRTLKWNLEKNGILCAVLYVLYCVCCIVWAVLCVLYCVCCIQLALERLQWGTGVNTLLLISENQNYKVDRNFKHKKNINCSAYAGTSCNSKYRILTALTLLFRIYKIIQ